MDKDRPKYGDHMVGTDLLSLFKCAAMIADRYLIDITGPPLGDGQDLGMLAPSHPLEFVRWHEVPAEKHVAAIDVSEGSVI